MRARFVPCSLAVKDCRLGSMRTLVDSKLEPDVTPPAPMLTPDGIVTCDNPLPGRTVIRKQGCYNCKHWTNGETFVSHRKTRRMADMRDLLERGVSLEQAERDIARADQYLEMHSYGVCLIGGGQADFVPARYLCGKWNGRIRVEGQMDKLADEMKDIMGDPA
jgi:hypothetical protein